MEPTSEVLAALQVVVNGLIDDPHKATFTVIEQKQGETMFQVRVAPYDIGKLIGKQGRTARAVRTIIAGMGMKVGHRYTLDIVETPPSPRGKS